MNNFISQINSFLPNPLAVIAAVISIVIGMFVVNHVLTVVLRWPRILIKYLHKEGRDIRRGTLTIQALQFLLLAIIFLITALTRTAFSENVLKITGIAAFSAFAFEFIQYYLCGELFGSTLLGPPPRSLLREIGPLWANHIVWIICMPLMFGLLVGAHFVGVLALFFGAILGSVLEKQIPKDEEIHHIDSLLGSLEKEGNERYVASIVLSDIVDPRSTEALLSLLSHEDKPIVRVAIDALVKRKELQAGRIMLQLLKAIPLGSTYRSEIVRAITQIMPEDDEALKKALESDNEMIRQGAQEVVKIQKPEPLSRGEKIGVAISLIVFLGLLAGIGYVVIRWLFS